ncbi:winged helix-turn-helix domain-containing protein [Brumimicrobium aurantiacum]|uniref:Transcriptional regulator n=1 Tax=Brumimicrobium aurantiacum TaxID=1737063 RepID=A0A3E1EXF2_9FLAO|nr:transcriptional regulator [Brumimicrobium aurantiacum]RFC54208.1 transcriptional regulator [Brumimicrobium aurantiacum]
MNVQELNKDFENRTRLGIMSSLMVNDWLSFKDLKELLNVTDGNLASHIKGLERKEYIEVKKEFIDRKPNTTYRVTQLGRMEFKKHIEILEKLIKGE